MHVRRMPKVSIFMAGTTKRVTEKTQFFWPKLRYNGRVMAREVFFYQCRWVTKFFAKFGCIVYVKGASPFVDTFRVNLVDSIWTNSLCL